MAHDPSTTGSFLRSNVLEALDRTVLRVPDKVAFSNGTEALTFRQVHAQSRAVGTFLAQRGLHRRPVAVFMARHPKTVTAFLGVAAAGCFYAPLDEEMPAFRIELIFRTLSPACVICDAGTRKALDRMGYAGDAFLYDEIAATPEDPAALDAVRARHVDVDPLYVVFTSGSTGVPKGVVANHRSVIEYVGVLSDALGFSEETVFGMQVPLYFDACLKEIFPTLMFGATTYLIPKGLFMFPVRLVEYLNQHRVNTVCWVVSALTMISAFGTFEKAVPSSLRTVAFGSEVFPVRQLALWRKALPEAKFTNLYGPTEATGMTCFYHLVREFGEGESVPIGRPFPNREVLLLDDEGREAAPGELGEICMRGTSVTMGYYNAPDKTAAAFVQNPLNPFYPETIYRTGDLGRRNERGELMFVSRKDYQIKHMGHRIELGEIEADVQLVEGVRLACAVYDKPTERIVLYYVGSVSPADLLSELRTRLPRYMLPNAVEPLDRMPLTANAKIDRAALLAYTEQARGEDPHG